MIDNTRQKTLIQTKISRSAALDLSRCRCYFCSLSVVHGKLGIRVIKKGSRSQHARAKRVPIEQQQPTNMAGVCFSINLHKYEYSPDEPTFAAPIELENNEKSKT